MQNPDVEYVIYEECEPSGSCCFEESANKQMISMVKLIIQDDVYNVMDLSDRSTSVSLSLIHI